MASPCLFANVLYEYARNSASKRYGGYSKSAAKALLYCVAEKAAGFLEFSLRNRIHADSEVIQCVLGGGI